MQGLVSILTPSYNHQPYIKQLMESIKEQSYQDIEFILIDDGSTDRTYDLVCEFGTTHQIKHFQQKNLGICKTLNRLYSMAKGEFVVFIASDDYMPLSRIEEQVKILTENVDLSAISGEMTQVDENNNIGKYLQNQSFDMLKFDDVAKVRPIPARICTAMFRKEDLNEIFPLPEDLEFEDLFIWLSLLKKKKKVKLYNQNWCYYRVNTNKKVQLNKEIWYHNGRINTLKRFDGTTFTVLNARVRFLAKLFLRTRDNFGLELIKKELSLNAALKSFVVMGTLIKLKLQNLFTKPGSK